VIPSFAFSTAITIISTIHIPTRLRVIRGTGHDKEKIHLGLKISVKEFKFVDRSDQYN
jgi:hypothetical protein